ncbi:uncharacterized protein LOC130997533 isoform X2 [Salvia miltiorrhiza]|uniref:uncharacterized protein LOC130997533 isoform X2 n=1 Tax=Salvia miltiorrhiza TaxID=226208 RepID=UPI0025AB7DE1|nr:uncharacterized protein LOC130997533 isoform X2 [Salvia miltiorrhiza]
MGGPAITQGPEQKIGITQALSPPFTRASTTAPAAAAAVFCSPPSSQFQLNNIKDPQFYLLIRDSKRNTTSTEKTEDGHRFRCINTMPSM